MIVDLSKHVKSRITDHVVNITLILKLRDICIDFNKTSACLLVFLLVGSFYLPKLLTGSSRQSDCATSPLYTAMAL